MRMASIWIGLAVALAANAWAAPPTAPQSAPRLPNPEFTRQNDFTIPFRLAPPKAAPGQSAPPPAEVQLHVSEDHGRTWQLSAKVAPDLGRFAFKAPYDGEYCFMVRTLDPQGRVWPSGPPVVGLRVVVDTAQPTLELKAARGEAGEVIVRWRIEDPNLRTSSFKVEYQVAGVDSDWQSVANDPLSTSPNGPLYTGETTWWPEATPKLLAIRAEVSDWAGNRAVSQTQLDTTKAMEFPLAENVPPPLPNNADIGPRSQSVGFPGVREPRTPATTLWPAERTASTPLSPSPSAKPADSTDTLPQMARKFPVTWPAGENRYGQPAEGANRYPRSDQTGRTPFSPAGNSLETVLPPPEQIAPGIPGPALEGRNPNTPPVRSATDTRFPDSPFEPPVQTQTDLLSESSGGLPLGMKPRMVNVRHFRLDYDTESVGSSGIRKVELWGTNDGGATWSSYGVDPDNRSPCDVKVSGEGTYGFRFVVESGLGWGGNPPKSGDLPDIWIGVDLTKPRALLTGVEQGRGEHVGELNVTWEASDDRLAARPITLQFSDSPSGPWSVIAAGLENSGHYAWRLDNRVPERLYLRMEVRDEAGNVQSVANPEPVSLDLARPRIRIRDVIPVDDSAAKPKRTAAR